MSTTPERTAAPAHKPFADWLYSQRGGHLHAELSEALAEVSAAVTDTGLAGTVSLTVTIKPLSAPGGMTSQLVVQDEVKTKVPRRPNEPSIWFLDDEGSIGLQREDPRQMRLALVEVQRADAPLREVGDGLD